MALTTNSGVVSITSGFVHPDAMDVACLILSNTVPGGAPADLTLQESDASTVIMTITIPEDDSVVIPYDGPHGKHFPNGMTFTSGNVIVSAFLAD